MLRGMLLMAVINLIVQWSAPYAKDYLKRPPDTIDHLQERIELNITKLQTAQEDLQVISSKLQIDLGGLLGVLQRDDSREKKKKSIRRSAQSARVNVREMEDAQIRINVLKSILSRDIDDLEESLGLHDSKTKVEEKETPKEQRYTQIFSPQMSE